MTKAEQQLKDLKDQLDDLERNQGSRREKQKIRNKIDRIQRNALRKKKGETHWRRGPRGGKVRGLWWLLPLDLFFEGLDQYYEEQYQRDPTTDFERCAAEGRCA